MSSGTTFDPSREWLGIDAVDLADPRLVLGLSSGPVDREAIIVAAEARLAKLRGLDPGPFTVARTALVKRVEESRDGLLAALPARPGSSFAPPPPPGALPRPAFPVPSGRRSPASSPQRATPQRPPPPPSAAITRPGPSPNGPTSADPVPARFGPRTERSRRSPWLFLLAMLAVTAAVGIAFRDRLLPHGDRLVALARNQAEQMAEVVAPSTAPTAPAATPSPPAETRQDEPPPLVRESQPVSPPATASETPATPPPSSSVPVPTLPSQPEPPQPDPPPRAKPSRPVAKDAAQLDDLLAGARRALAAEDFAQADEWLGRARNAVGDGPGGDRVAGWEQLAAHARQFARFRGEALRKGAGRDFDVGQDRISVVEVTDRMFIFRHEGQNIRLPINKVPEAIAMTMTKQWFAGGGHAANHLFIGARYLTRSEPDPAAARTAWQAAQRGGEDVSLLIPLLDDPLLRGPPPRR